MKSIKNHIDYITRNGQIDFYLPTTEQDKSEAEYRIGLTAGEQFSAPNSLKIRNLIKSQYEDFIDDTFLQHINIDIYIK